MQTFFLACKFFFSHAKLFRGMKKNSFRHEELRHAKPIFRHAKLIFRHENFIFGSCFYVI
jgi:hypothetical protein